MESVFKYSIKGIELYADALRVRRLLLSKTDGRAWTYIRDLALLKEEAAKIKEDPELTTEQREARLGINRVSTANLEGMLSAAAIHAFEFPPFDQNDGSGVTELEALVVLSQYMDFAAKKD